MDLNRMKVIVSEFAKQYHFLEWKDIANVVTKSKPIFTKKQLQMDGKSFVQIIERVEKNTNKKYVLLFIGKIYFELESTSKEIYSVDTDNHSFSINLSEISDEQTLIETILEKCKEYDFL